MIAKRRARTYHGVQFILNTLTNAEYGAVKATCTEIKAVGHRVLHGGTKFSGSVLIDDAVIAAVEECCDLGPLHNPANPERYLRRTETSAGSTAGSCIRYCIPPDYAGLRLPVPDTLQVFRKIRYPSLWFPRNFSPLRFKACM